MTSISKLPIEAVLPELRSVLAQQTSAVLQAPPGAGKTTRVPLALLDAPWLAGRSILMLEPRRLAARAAAERMAAELGERVGETVGYRVRFDSRVSAATRIEVLTEGILARRIQQDPELENVGLVIFDEFHERHLQGDLALALCLDLRASLREDLRILVMSATLDGTAVAGLLEAPIIASEGRAYPVALHHLAAEPSAPLPHTMVAALHRALEETEGDILAFLPGSGEIRRTQQGLEERGITNRVIVAPLYGDLRLEAQQAAIHPNPQGRRRIVLATNIAETSLTIEGVSVVVDGGWMRTPRFDPRTGLTRLVTVRVSRASADQRAGRAGRLGPGTCYRLWTEGTERALLPFNPPEIQAADLASLALDLALWGVSDPATLRWLDSPPAGALAQARSLLTLLDALDDAGRVTALGRAMGRLPMHPRLARMLVEGERLGAGALACDLAAVIAEREVFRGERREPELVRHVEALQAFRREGRTGASRFSADPGACAMVERAAGQWRRLLREPPQLALDESQVGLLLAFAYPDRIAVARGSGRFQLSNGRRVRLAQGSPLTHQALLVAAAVEPRGDEDVIQLAVALASSWLETELRHRLQVVEEVVWDPRQQAVSAVRETRVGEALLHSEPRQDSDKEGIQAAMLAGVRQLGLEALPWTPEARQLQARLDFLRNGCGEEEWPEVSDAALLNTLDDWLAPYLGGMSRRAHLARLDLHAILLAGLDWPTRQRLAEGAPTHLTVPSGSHRRLDYQPGGSVILAVKIQEMFGLADTPRVAWGRIPVTLHLLSPAQRPIQVTQDLRGFWERTYAEVKKELKGRYPKHPWPDDPWTTPPTANAKRRC